MRPNYQSRQALEPRNRPSPIIADWRPHSTGCQRDVSLVNLPAPGPGTPNPPSQIILRFDPAAVAEGTRPASSSTDPGCRTATWPRRCPAAAPARPSPMMSRSPSSPQPAPLGGPGRGNSSRRLPRRSRRRPRARRPRRRMHCTPSAASCGRAAAEKRWPFWNRSPLARNNHQAAVAAQKASQYRAFADEIGTSYECARYREGSLRMHPRYWPSG